MEAAMPTPRVAGACEPFSEGFFAPTHIPEVSGTRHTVALHEINPHARRTEAAPRADAEDTPEWSEEDVVLLHWRLLLELRRLPDLDTPLEEKLDTLAWALTDPTLDDRPFSFANCLRVVGTSPLSPTQYFGAVQVDEVRDWLRANARVWLRATLARYPDWVQSLIRAHPDWVAKELRKNPQWINEQIRSREASGQADLF
jgi:hypothetical protein